jgi:hypothetical protein
VRSRIALAVLIVGAAFACPVDVAQAQYSYDDPGDPAPSVDSYQQTLSPYGSWQTDPSYGQYWQPRVAADWQPYSDGQWIWTGYGWTWVSNEPWGWTFHYGRWAYLRPRGWVWIPGTVWGPAWVSWVSYGGYIGWAPLSPFGGPGFNDFVFVHNADFCAPRLRTAIVRREFLPSAVSTRWHDHVVRSPERRFIEEVSRHPVRVMRDRPVSTLPPWQRADRGRPDLDSPRQPGAANDPGRGSDRNRPGRREPGLRAADPPARDHAERPWFRPPRGDRPRGDAPPAVQHPPGFDGDRRMRRSPSMARDPRPRSGGTAPPLRNGGDGAPVGQPPGRPGGSGGVGGGDRGSAPLGRGGQGSSGLPH